MDTGTVTGVERMEGALGVDGVENWGLSTFCGPAESV